MGEWRVVQVDGQTLLALPARGFEALMRNLAETVRWSSEASYQLDFYRETRKSPPADQPRGESQ